MTKWICFPYFISQEVKILMKIFPDQSAAFKRIMKYASNNSILSNDEFKYIYYICIYVLQTEIYDSQVLKLAVI